MSPLPLSPLLLSLTLVVATRLAADESLAGAEAAAVVTAAAGAGPFAVVPQSPPTSVVNYFCTWYSQNWPPYHAQAPDFALGDRALFGPASATDCPSCGWAHTFHPDARADLVFLLDNGWAQGEFQLNRNFTSELAGPGSTNWSASVVALSSRLTSLGWSGLGLWHHNISFAGVDGIAQVEAQAAAGVRYLKIDGGDLDCGVTAIARQHAPGLVTEHKRSPANFMPNSGPINAWCPDGPSLHNDTCSGRFLLPLGAEILGPILERTDVLRTNDVMIPMSIPTTLDRAAKLLLQFEGPNVARNRTAALPSRQFERVLGVQDEVYLGAALSMAFSVMRMPLPQQPTDDQMVGPRLLSRRMDEVTRAVRWHRLAPPMGAGFAPSSALLSDATNAGMGSEAAVEHRVLFDRARLAHATSRHFCDDSGCHMYQGAPAVVSRGLPSMPAITAVGESGLVPFVVAARHSNGAVSVGA
eukprot:COSAG06_NODE_10974_length_1588_cov_1.925453_1_plen_469_part_10